MTKQEYAYIVIETSNRNVYYVQSGTKWGEYAYTWDMWGAAVYTYEKALEIVEDIEKNNPYGWKPRTLKVNQPSME